MMTEERKQVIATLKARRTEIEPNVEELLRRHLEDFLAAGYDPSNLVLAALAVSCVQLVSLLGASSAAATLLVWSHALTAMSEAGHERPRPEPKSH